MVTGIRQLTGNRGASVESGIRSTAALVVLSIAAFAFVTTESLPIGLLPLISAGLGASAPDVGVLVTAYALVVVVASIPLTHITRRVSRRPLLAGLVGVFAVATVASAFAPTGDPIARAVVRVDGIARDRDVIGRRGPAESAHKAAQNAPFSTALAGPTQPLRQAPESFKMGH
jgi:O-antigen ligase